MKKVISYLIVIVLTFIGSFLAFSFLSDEAAETDPDTVNLTLHSTLLDEDREVIVRLPRLYDSTRHYPVLYALDAQSVDKPIADKLQILADAGVVPEAIVVGIPNMTGDNRELNLTPPFMLRDHEDATSGNGEADRFLEFLQQELIPFVEKKYPSSSRAFCGNSKGGLAVMYSLIRKPALFDARFCFSTPFWRQDDILIDSVAKFIQRTDSLQSFIYLSAGAAETDNIKGGLVRMKDVLQKCPGLIVHSAVTPQAVHANNAQRSATKALLEWAAFMKARSE